jgi:rapamycin-insensitive companion of mTOR
MTDKSTNQGGQITNILFSKERLERSMSPEYFDVLGKILTNSFGIKVLEEYRIINVLYSLTLIKNRDDIAMLMISKFDSTVEGHGRIILTRLLISGSKVCFSTTRLYEIKLIKLVAECQEKRYGIPRASKY